MINEYMPTNNKICGINDGRNKKILSLYIKNCSININEIDEAKIVTIEYFMIGFDGNLNLICFCTANQNTNAIAIFVIAPPTPHQKITSKSCKPI